MTVQIAVRIPNELAARMAEATRLGQAPNRTALVTRALERELRKLAAERDVELLRSDQRQDGLDALIGWAGRHSGDLDA